MRGYLFDVIQEFRIALRGLRRSPTFATAAILTLGLASAATGSILAVIDSVLLRPLPVLQQDRVVMAWKEDYASGFAHFPFSYPAVEALRAQLSTVSDVALIDYNGAWPLTSTDGDRAFKLPTGAVSGNLFGLLGVKPLAGRLFTAADDVPGGRHLIVIGEGLWRSRYGREATAIGRNLTVGGVAHEIVGIVPADFAYPRGAVAWIPMFTYGGRWLNDPRAVTQDMVARLKPGRTLEEFRAELEAARSRTSLEQLAEFKTQRVVARTFEDEVFGSLRPTLLLVAAGALLLLVVASVNVASLLLVRTGGKMHEVAVRAAIGGGRTQLLRAVLLEHIVLVTGGVTVGLGLAWLSLRAGGFLLPDDLPRSRALAFGVVPLVGGAGLGLGVGIAASIAPAIALLRADLSAALRVGGRQEIGGWGTHPMRRLLVAAQLGLATMAVAGAGLLVRTLDRLRSIEVGFQPERLLLIEVAMGRVDADTSTQRLWASTDRLVERLRLIPGVAAAGAALSPPFVGSGGFYAKVGAEGMSDADAVSFPLANIESVTPDYFSTLGMTLRRGRLFTLADRENAASVVVINEALARYLWPGRDPIGKRLSGYNNDSPTPLWRTVVGVVGDTRYNDLRVPSPTMYAPYRQMNTPPRYYFIRLTAANATGVVSAVRDATRQANAGWLLTTATPMPGLLGKPLVITTVATVLVTAFGLVAMLLAVIGIYGVISSYVLQRTREIGVRMALGADGGSVRRLVLRQGLGIVGLGTSVGLGAALLTGRALKDLLYEISPTDPVALLCALGA